MSEDIVTNYTNYTCGKIIRTYDKFSFDNLISAENRRKWDCEITFTNGCFDLFHVGHLNTLLYAKYIKHSDQFCNRNRVSPAHSYQEFYDRLVVGMNSDRSVRALKGNGRPIVPFIQRALIVAAYDFVDYVVEFDEDSVLDLILKIRPNILVKGGNTNVIVGEKEVLRSGGQVYKAPNFEGVSTSNIIGEIRKEFVKDLHFDEKIISERRS